MRNGGSEPESLAVARAVWFGRTPFVHLGVIIPADYD
jgi:hypothetical protein